MNAFTYERTYSYLYARNKYVNVRKYLIAKDEDGQRYAIFQLVNNYRDTIQAVKIKVEQYDKNNNIVYTNEIPYDGLSIKHHGKFVPFFKLAIDDKTVRIVASLVAAKFENHIYRDEKMVRIKKEKAEVEKELKDHINKRYNALASKSPIKSFIIMSTIVTVLMAIFIGAFSIINKNSIVDDFEYNRSTGEIVAYTGTSRYITVPSTIKNTAITSVASRAFMNSDLIMITFESSEIEIGQSAFMNCKNLVQITGNTLTDIGQSAFENCYQLSNLQVSGIESVGPSAFKNCRALVEFNFADCKKLSSFAFNNCDKLERVETPNAIVSTNLFLENPQLTSFTFADVDVYYNRLFTIFSSENEFPQLTVNMNMSAVDNDFITNFSCKAINFINPSLNLNSKVKQAWIDSAKKNNAYIETSAYIKIYDVIDSFKQVTTNLSLSDPTIRGITGAAWSQVATNLESLQLNNYIYLSKDLLNQCRKLTYLEVGTNNAIDDNALASTVLQTIVMPINGSSFVSKFMIKPVVALDVRITSGALVPKNYFADCSFIKSIQFDSSIVKFNEDCINNCTSLEQITIASENPILTKGFIGAGCTRLNTVTIPYIGTSKSEPIKYAELNVSAQYTKTLIISSASSIKLAEGCFDRCAMLEYVKAPYGFTPDTKNILDGKTILSKLYIGFSVGASLKTLIGNNNSVQNLLVTDVRTFPDSYFNGAYGAKVYLGANTSVHSNLLKGNEGLAALYISSNASRPFSYLANVDFEGAVTRVYDTKVQGDYNPRFFEYTAGYDVDGIISGLFN